LLTVVKFERIALQSLCREFNFSLLKLPLEVDWDIKTSLEFA